jgi:hypothetical protein
MAKSVPHTEEMYLYQHESLLMENKNNVFGNLRHS